MENSLTFEVKFLNSNLTAAMYCKGLVKCGIAIMKVPGSNHRKTSAKKSSQRCYSEMTLNCESTLSV